MAAHRYWRVNLGTGNANSRIWLNNLEMRGTPSGPDLTVPGGPWAVNAQDATEIGARAIDGSDATAWNSGVSPSVAVAVGTYDFGAPTVIVEMALLFSNASGAPDSTSWVSASDDGAVFTPVFSDMVRPTWPAGVLTTVKIGEDAAPLRLVAESLPLLLPMSWPPGPAGARLIPADTLRTLGVDGGAFRVAGAVFVDGTPDVPVARRIRLFERLTGRLLRETWSDPVTGAYAFDGVPGGLPYFVVAHDHTGVHNAVIKDSIAGVLP